MLIGDIKMHLTQALLGPGGKLVLVISPRSNVM